jgi:hypothetical protein
MGPCLQIVLFEVRGRHCPPEGRASTEISTEKGPPGSGKTTPPPFAPNSSAAAGAGPRQEDRELRELDFNQDGLFDISDPVGILGYLYLGTGGSPCTGESLSEAGNLALLSANADVAVRLRPSRAAGQPPVRSPPRALHPPIRSGLEALQGRSSL